MPKTFDSKFALRLEEVRTSVHPTQLPVGPEAALRVARSLMQQNGDENRIVYLVSDYRSKEWDNPSEVRQLLSELEKEEAQIRLVNCVRTQRANLAVTGLRPTDETRASGVPLFMNVDITNFGDTAAENVPLKIRTFFYASDILESGSSQRPVGKADESPMLQMARIEPGETATQRVQVFFPEAGKHVVEAMLPDDSVAADNRRWCVVEFPDQETVCVVDGDPSQRNAFYIEAIFQPGQRARTGIRPDLQTIPFLRDTTPEVLRRYSAIYLFDVDRLDDRALTNLETYAREGGGVAFFVGPQVNIAFYNERLYRGGEGLFPLAIARDDLLDSDPSDDTPDVEVEIPDHPVFRELVQGQNPIVRMIHVERFLRPEADWMPDANSSVRVLARLRNRAPLAVEKSFGQGRVITFLTTYAPYWNDIALGPGVILALRLQSHLGFSQRVTDVLTVATEIDVRLDRERYRQDVKVFLPGNDPSAPILIERPAAKQAEDPRFMTASIGADETQRSGIYEMWFNRTDGAINADRFAVNIDAREGNLAQTPTRNIVASLDPVAVDMGYADQYETTAIEQAGFNQSLLLMCLLLLLLFGEQLLAYFTSFHPARRSGTTSEMGRRSHTRSALARDADDSVWASAAVGRGWIEGTTGGDVPNLHTTNSETPTSARGA